MWDSIAKTITIGAGVSTVSQPPRVRFISAAICSITARRLPSPASHSRRILVSRQAWCSGVTPCRTSCCMRCFIGWPHSAHSAGLFMDSTVSANKTEATDSPTVCKYRRHSALFKVHTPKIVTYIRECALGESQKWVLYQWFTKEKSADNRERPPADYRRLAVHKCRRQWAHMRAENRRLTWSKPGA